MNISIRIDVEKVDKELLYKGKQGTYLNATLIEKQTEYNDFFIVQEVSKEQHDAGMKGEIIGNAKYFRKREKTSSPAKYSKPADNRQEPDKALPF